jgi:hypothetical protein
MKVSQSTIDDIKKMGMTKALKLAGMNSKADQSGMVGEFAEGVRRMYGDRRYQAIINKTYPTDPASKTNYKARAAAAKGNK